ncbi:MAG: hypothetical protein FJ096_02485 [Deltaproteobacteria bacterium]|nr:hypothetical protein [Deltaproteobacteria bacterium]
MPSSFLPIALDAAAKAFGFLVPLLVMIAPFALPPVVQKIDEKQRRRLLAATKAAVIVVGEFASKTPTTMDDKLVEVLRAVENELGRSLRPSETRLVQSFARTLHADPRFPARLASTITVVGKD